MNNKHTFALYYPLLTGNQRQEIVDHDLVHRIVSIVRLEEGEQLHLFNETHEALCTLVGRTKKSLTIELVHYGVTKQPGQSIALYCGLLKKDSFEEILYNAAELGVTSIYPVISDKIHKQWWSDNYKERFQKIMIAACEQSKNFVIPQLYSPIAFSAMIEQCAKKKEVVWFDVDGEHCSTLIKSSHKNACCIIGPEGDFSPAEKEALMHHAQRIRLTKTVLRSIQAVTVGLGLVLSIMNEA